MVIDSLVFKPTHGGLRHGLFTLELRLGLSGPSFSSSELVTQIFNAARTYSNNTLLTIQDFYANNAPEEIMELASSLSDTFEVTAEITGYKRPGWLSKAKRIRAFIGEEPWLRYRADEIFFQPDTWEVKPSPPDVGPANVNALRYLMVNRKGTDAQAVLDFVRTGPLPWMMLSSPLFTTEVKIL